MQQDNLEAVKMEISLHDDCVDQWVSDVQQWAEGIILICFVTILIIGR